MLKDSIGLQVGLWQEAQETLQRMQADGVQPNTVAYNALIKALGSGGQWQQVDCAWTHRLFAIVLNVGLYTTCCCKGIFCALQAMDVFETMQSCAANASECCCNPDLVTYSSIVSACQKSLQWEKALDVYEVRVFKQWHMQLKGMCRQGLVAPLEACMCIYALIWQRLPLFCFHNMTCFVSTI